MITGNGIWLCALRSLLCSYVAPVLLQIDMMVKLGTKPKAQTTHFMPLAMSTAEIMPPPKTTEKALGEERIVHYTGAGVAAIEGEGGWEQFATNLAFVLLHLLMP